MRERSCGVPEERWIDLLGGRLYEREVKALIAHKAECRECRDTHAQWAKLLGGGLSAAGLPVRQAGPCQVATQADAAAQSGAAQVLSARRRRSLLLHAGVYAFARRAGRALVATAKRPARAAACGLGVAVAALLLLLHPLASKSGRHAGSELSPAGYARLHEPEGATVIGEPDTVVYKYGENGRSGTAIGLPGGAKETLWLNARTHELFFADGRVAPFGPHRRSSMGEVRRDERQSGPAALSRQPRASVCLERPPRGVGMRAAHHRAQRRQSDADQARDRIDSASRGDAMRHGNRTNDQMP
ncbi:hypothetical protein [Cohnella rhizosphaerae]|uniref:Zinc-finger domain-containing protein n=1 Tax=Cohnella rhizosphaerae TaxID=1457232 RepID=A0A9X4KXM8_9BACL|nr:hypothetical protein [Cohnella rhizosphaerae]MDG0813171.1 hypothetical protein [Cohnella rhizosphaerae]